MKYMSQMALPETNSGILKLHVGCVMASVWEVEFFMSFTGYINLLDELFFFKQPCHSDSTERKADPQFYFTEPTFILHLRGH